MRPTPNLKTTSMTASRSLEISRDRNQVCLSLRRIGRLTLTLTLTAAAANSTPGHKQTKNSKVHLGSLKTFLFSLFPGNHKKFRTSFFKDHSSKQRNRRQCHTDPCSQLFDDIFSQRFNNEDNLKTYTPPPIWENRVPAALVGWSRVQHSVGLHRAGDKV